LDLTKQTKILAFMKRHQHHFLLPLFVLLINVSFAQEGSQVYSKGYNHSVESMAPLQDGTWLLLSKYSPLPGAIYADTMTVYHVDSIGNVLKEINLQPPVQYETMTIEFFKALPDGSFAVCYSGGDCDAGGYGYFIEKRDTTGQLHWTRTLPEGYYAFEMAISPDSNILVCTGEINLKLSSTDGHTIWELPFHDGYGYDYLFVPGSENILMVNQIGFSYYRLDSTSGQPEYNLAASEPYTPSQGSIGELFTDGAGTFYAISYYEKKLLRFKDDLQPEVMATFKHLPISYSCGHEGVYTLIRRNFNATRLVFVAEDGDTTLVHQFPDTGIRQSHIYYQPNGFALAGGYGSGPHYTEYPGLTYAGRSQAWFRFYPDYNLDSIIQTPDILISRIVQRDEIQYTSFWSPGPFPANLHHFSGGDFEMLVTNGGNLPVHTFWLNIAFGPNINTWWCPPSSAHQIKFNIAPLMPGDSIWVDFGDIQASSQEEIPDAFCFWTSAPNYFPDFVPTNDVYCKERTVSVGKVVEEKITLYPNPVADELYINWPSENEGSADWYIADMLGQIVLKGHNSDLNADPIPVSGLAPGVYIFNAASFSEKIIVSH
jgi:hypothetical protein